MFAEFAVQFKEHEGENQYKQQEQFPQMPLDVILNENIRKIVDIFSTSENSTTWKLLETTLKSLDKPYYLVIISTKCGHRDL